MKEAPDEHQGAPREHQIEFWVSCEGTYRAPAEHRQGTMEAPLEHHDQLW